MVKAVRIFAEGGGDGKNSKLQFRHGLNKFFNELTTVARDKRIRWDLIACGSRNNAYSDFVNDELHQDPDAAVILLVDSEGPVSERCTPRQHLQQRDPWDMKRCDDNQCHLMVEMMEAWFIADLEALARFYGNDFNRKQIPANPNVEEIPKDVLEKSLRAATRQTKKGVYHKGKHSHEILKRIDPDLVCKRAPHCKRLFNVLTRAIETSA
jgi:hypothetical protein